MKPTFLLVTLPLVVIFSTSSCAIADKYPSNFANEYGCEEIMNFHEGPGRTSPSYIYAFDSDGVKEEVYFWCRSKVRGEQYRLILIDLRKSKDKCHGLIFETGNFPGGLSLIAADGVTLTGYLGVTTGNKFSTSNYTGTIVESLYDGVGETFVCIDGVWHVKLWD